MPSAAAVKEAFGICTNNRIGKWEIVSCRLSHVVVRDTEEYHFPGTITLRHDSAKKMSRSVLLKAVAARLKDSKIAYSEYGSPYECKFTAPSLVDSDTDSEEVNLVTLELKCVALRRRDIPTIRQQTEDSQDDQAKQDAANRIAELKAHGFRVIKSRFATSRCKACDSLIAAGEHITKHSSGTVWTHLACAQIPAGSVATAAKPKRAKRAATDNAATTPKRVTKRKTAKN